MNEIVWSKSSNVNEKLAIYGFGSHFERCFCPSDIDILIVHESSKHGSCNLAIDCKNFIAANINGTDITILSKQEEQLNSFISLSRAKFIGNLSKHVSRSDVELLLDNIELAKTHAS